MASMEGKTICVLGLGYIGLPSAAVLAARGYSIRGVDVNQDTVASINSGKTHISEPELDILVRASVQTGRLQAFSTPEEADIFILCVPTPFINDHEPDLSFLFKATESICPFIKPGNLVIIESTIPPGTTENIAAFIEKNSPFKRNEVYLAHAPERVLPGKILREVVENDRIIGGINESSSHKCKEFYQTFVSGMIYLTSARTAETVKLVENAFRDVNIAFANELSMMADVLDVDVWEVIRLANLHPRVNILSPGSGVGGHCIAIDPWFLVHSTPELTRLIQTARQVNIQKPQWLLSRVKRRADRFKKPKIACLGLTYKPNIDDLRESPALEVVRALQKETEFALFIVEPNLQSHPEFDLMGLKEALVESDIVVFLVAHRQFKNIPHHLLAEKTIIDACGALVTNG